MQCPVLLARRKRDKAPRGASPLGQHYILAMQSSRVYRNASRGDARRRKSALLRNQSTITLRSFVVPAHVFGPRDRIKFYIRFIYSSKSRKDAAITRLQSPNFEFTLRYSEQIFRTNKSTQIHDGLPESLAMLS